MSNSDIDFVIIWVDGSDPEWIAEKNKYDPSANTDSRPERYRDWDLLRYWFRGIEKFTPWVRKIHFVTWGHLPSWLNTDAPKLNIVNHKDYIPEKYLPTFSANPIELNLHRIEGLSEKFVFFNDDTFIIKPCKETVFFKNDLPCDSAVLSVHCYSPQTTFHFCPFRDIGMINSYFDMKEVIKKDFFKWINPIYGTMLLRTLVLLPCPRFPGIWQHHLPASYLKETFKTVWDLEPEELDSCCTNKFRHMLDYNQWLMKEWQLASGKFSPRGTKIGRNMQLGGADKCEDICDYVSRQRGKMVCINDGDMTWDEYEKYKSQLKTAFDKILPEKSGFEI